jgi:peptidoglycan/LPS O-acetylase OafA/YrhL
MTVDRMTNDSKSKLEGLNALRGWAAVLIVIFHVQGIHGLKLPAEMGFITRYFGLGVPLFFVISAYSLFLSTRSRVGTEGWLSAYAIRRIMRIAPLFYVTALFYIVYIPIQFGVYNSLESIISTLSFLFNLIPGKHESMIWAGWTVGVEMLFYLVLPYLFIFVRNVPTSIAATFLSIVFSAVLYKFYSTNNYPPGYAYMSFLSSLGVFMYGVAGYFIFNSARSNPRKNLIGSVLFIISLIGAMALVYLEDKLIGIVGNRSLLWGADFSLLITAQCLKPVFPITNRYAAYLGNLSFGVYLCHPPLVYMLKPIYLALYGSMSEGFAFGLAVILTLTLLIPVAAVANRLIEKPGIRFGEWLIAKRLGQDACLAK